MTTEEAQMLHRFETRVRQLMMEHTSVVKEKKELELLLAQRNVEISKLNEKIAELEQQYTNLKLAKMVEISSSETESAQKRIAKLIRQIDKCIALLNI